MLDVGGSLEIGCWDLVVLQIGCWNRDLYWLRRRDSVLEVLPERNELVPLFDILLYDGFEGRHDFLRELLADRGVAQGGAVVGNLLKNVSFVSVSAARQIDGQQDAAGGAGEFGGGGRGGEWVAEEIDGGGRGGQWAI